MTTKEILRVNLFPNQHFLSTGCRYSSKTGEGTVTYAVAAGGSDEMSLRSADDDGFRVAYDIDGFTPGAEYVIEANVWVSGDYAPNMTAPILIGSIDSEGANWRGIGKSNEWKNGSARISARFTVPSGITRIRIEFCSPKSSGAIANWNSPQLELASTYDAAKAGGGGLLFFAWDTMPRD